MESKVEVIDNNVDISINLKTDIKGFSFHIYWQPNNWSQVCFVGEIDSLTEEEFEAMSKAFEEAKTILRLKCGMLDELIRPLGKFITDNSMYCLKKEV